MVARPRWIAKAQSKRCFRESLELWSGFLEATEGSSWCSIFWNCTQNLVEFCENFVDDQFLKQMPVLIDEILDRILVEKNRVEFDPVVPKLTRFDPVVPKLKFNLILSFQIQKMWSCRSKFKKCDPAVPKLKLNLILSFQNWKYLILSFQNWKYLILSFQIQKNWSCRS